MLAVIPANVNQYVEVTGLKHAKDGEKFECDCGHMFVDIYDYNPQKGTIIRDQDLVAYQKGIENDLIQFIEAIKNNKRVEWAKNYLDKYSSPNMSDQGIIGNILINHQLQYELRIFECPKCRSIYIETNPGSNNFRRYSPENGDNILVLTSH